MTSVCDWNTPSFSKMYLFYNWVIVAIWIVPFRRNQPILRTALVVRYLNDLDTPLNKVDAQISLEYFVFVAVGENLWEKNLVKIAGNINCHIKRCRLVSGRVRLGAPVATKVTVTCIQGVLWAVSDLMERQLGNFGLKLGRRHWRRPSFKLKFDESAVMITRRV